MVIAFFHVVGAIGLTIAFGVAALMFAAWQQTRIDKRRLQDAAIALGVPVSAIESDEQLTARLIQYSSQRYSSELLRNRIADLCGTLSIAWAWLSNIVQLCVIATVGWLMFTEGEKNAIGMWGVLLLAVIFWLASLTFSFACAVLTGRYPGEPKAARNKIAAVIEKLGAAEHASTEKVSALAR